MSIEGIVWKMVVLLVSEEATTMIDIRGLLTTQPLALLALAGWVLSACVARVSVVAADQ